MPPIHSRLTPTYGYNVKSGRYTNLATGRYVKAEQVRAGLDTALQRSQNEIMRVSRELQAGNMSVAEWQVAMAREMRDAHTASAALAKGGWAQMTARDWGKLGPAMKDQYGYLANFGQQIVDGEQRLDTLGFLSRANMYAQAARGTYHAFETAAMSERGMTEVKSVLGMAEHCGQCIGEAARDWVPIGEEVPIGERQCLTHCHCSLQFR